ncbi:ATP-dependent endonuclease of the OLD family-like protein [Vitreoscilla filiformis]|uniref:ATP-dependent endonuclease of the OLD family-like protein n=1 Tax=Vitreoscilla filiformis TaxID=63 RepID=A0A221KG62_VITFI|nr:AAA family ATPase [Vitreoscilla filiformis]ASM78032.1 ATP-dependent endonuclease of the OLD family-like protein [Vitreoscilla filiformis]
MTAIANPKICRLVVKNFRSVGSNSISVDIDKIVILVGANNSGKSTILRAFEVVADNLKLEIDDFHNKTVVQTELPEIELHSLVVDENKPGSEWCEEITPQTWLVKEKWTWSNHNVEPKRVGFNVSLNRWAAPGDPELMPWGPNNVAKARRPKPHRVSTFDNPEYQAKATTSLLKSLLENDIKNIKSNPNDPSTRYEQIVESLINLRADSKAIQTAGIVDIETQANLIIEQIFPGHQLKVISSESTTPINIDLLGEEFGLEIGVPGATSFPLDKQGSGTQRTALWTILKLLADKGVKAKPVGKTAKTFHEPIGPNTSHILLIDEPEVSLHPKAIQSARDVLYSLPDSDNWQVMLTTHSPSFIDLTKNNTTIIRVEKTLTNGIGATTLFTPEAVRLDEDDKENLKLVNLFDSHISEAFFGGSIIIVEGDTEYSAFNYIKNREADLGSTLYNDVSIIRARGKVTVASMMKVLNHFKANYFVLHDTDTETVTSKIRDRQASTGGRIVYREITITNPAWTNNTKIFDQMSPYSRVVASAINFEEAYFGEVVSKDKPENCINHLKTDADCYNIIKQLLDAILEINGATLPDGAVRWQNIAELTSAVSSWNQRVSNGTLT